jgi:hypothetical protein
MLLVYLIERVTLKCIHGAVKIFKRTKPIRSIDPKKILVLLIIEIDIRIAIEIEKHWNGKCSTPTGCSKINRGFKLITWDGHLLGRTV